MSRKLVFVVDGEEIAIDADENESVMRNAKAHDIPGIDADCGGMMACGTCHVYVLDGRKTDLPEPSDMEAEMLEYVPEFHAQARLSCQIRVSDCPDNIRFQVPPAQR